MFLVHLMQYTFLASIAFDVVVAAWVVKNSWRIMTTVIKLYYLTLGIIIGWEIVTYISFFYQRSTQFNFVFNASTFALGLAGIFSILYFSWYFVERKYLSKVVVWLFFMGTLVTAALAYVPHLMVGEKIFSSQSELFYLTNAPLTIPFYFFILVQFLALLTLLVRSYRRSVGRKKQEVKIMVIGFGGIATAAILTYVIVPLIVKTFVGSSDAIALSVAVQQIISGVFMSAISIAIAYAILRYRIFNIHYQLKRAVLIMTLYIAGLVIIVGIFFVMADLLQNTMNDSRSFLLLVMFSFTILYLKYVIDRVVRKIFPQLLIDTYQLTAEDQVVIRSLPSADMLVRTAVGHFMQYLPVEKITIYLYDHRSLCFVSVYPDTKFKIALDEPWLVALQNGSSQESTKHKLLELGCIQLFPVVHNEQTLAIIGIGSRIDQRDFSDEDKKFIKQFEKFFGYNIWNYLHIQQFTYDAIDKRK